MWFWLVLPPLILHSNYTLLPSTLYSSHYSLLLWLANHYALFLPPLGQSDVDECQEMTNGGCEGECCNTIGSYYCKCRPGFKLGEDGKTCKGKKIVQCSMQTCIANVSLIMAILLSVFIFISFCLFNSYYGSSSLNHQ